MTAPRPIIGLNELHLLAKVLDCADTHHLVRRGTWTARELAVAASLFHRLDLYLDEKMGENWNDQEALV